MTDPSVDLNPWAMRVADEPPIRYRMLLPAVDVWWVSGWVQDDGEVQLAWKPVIAWGLRAGRRGDRDDPDSGTDDVVVPLGQYEFGETSLTELSETEAQYTYGDIFGVYSSEEKSDNAVIAELRNRVRKRTDHVEKRRRQDQERSARVHTWVVAQPDPGAFASAMRSWCPSLDKAYLALALADGNGPQALSYARQSLTALYKLARERQVR